MRIEPQPQSTRDSSNVYVERVNRAIDYIIAHLAEDLSLEVVASAAHFSRFHFHRVFQAIMGETLGQFVKRLRLERALTMIAHGRKQSLTEIALATGFGSSSDFSRSFRQRYGVPPSAFDIDVFRDKNRQDLKAAMDGPTCNLLTDRLPVGRNPDGFQVALRTMPPRSIAYIRVLEPFVGGSVKAAAERLTVWAEARGFAEGQWLGYMWDKPEIVALSDCRYDLGVVLPSHASDVRPDGEVGRLEFPEMLVAEVEVRGGIELEQRAWHWIFGTWLPSSGYVPTDQPSMEVFIGRPFGHGDDYFELFGHVPIERL